jgi:iron complex transport system substrate-binding protein
LWEISGRHPIHALYAFDTAITVNNVFNYTETEKKYLKRSFYDDKPYALENASEEIIRLKPDIVLFADLLTRDNIERADAVQEKNANTRCFARQQYPELHRNAGLSR